MSADDKDTNEKSKKAETGDMINAKDEENSREGNEATRGEERETENQMKKEYQKGKEDPKEKNRWVNDVDFLESLSEEETHEIYDSFRTERRLDSNGLKRFLLNRYGVKVRDIRRFYDNLCLYCEE